MEIVGAKDRHWVDADCPCAKPPLRYDRRRKSCRRSTQDACFYPVTIPNILSPVSYGGCCPGGPLSVHVASLRYGPLAASSPGTCPEPCRYHHILMAGCPEQASGLLYKSTVLTGQLSLWCLGVLGVESV